MELLNFITRFGLLLKMSLYITEDVDAECRWYGNFALGLKN